MFGLIRWKCLDRCSESKRLPLAADTDQTPACFQGEDKSFWLLNHILFVKPLRVFLFLFFLSAGCGQGDGVHARRRVVRLWDGKSTLPALEQPPLTHICFLFKCCTTEISKCCNYCNYDKHIRLNCCSNTTEHLRKTLQTLQLFPSNCYSSAFCLTNSKKPSVPPCAQNKALWP